MSLIGQEEWQKMNFREKDNSKIGGESSAFFAKKNTESSEQDEKRGLYSRSGMKLDTRFYYDNCKFYDHLRKDCWHLIGFPKDKEQKKNQKEKKMPRR